MNSTSLKLRNFIIVWGFAASGAAALVYEVIWQRALTNTIGSSAYTFSIIVAAFMAGLAVGGRWGGVRLAHSRDGVRVFAWLQLATGVFGFATFYFITALRPLYEFIFHLSKGSTRMLTLSQMALVFLVMLVPGTLMGAAFPVITKAWSLRSKGIGRTAGDIYSVNTWGSVFGALAAGFVLVPMVGLWMSNLIAVVLNISLGAFALFVSLAYEPPYPLQDANSDGFHSSSRRMAGE